MLAIGAVIGAGIFGALGTAAAGQVGPDGAMIRYGAGRPALVFSFLLLGGACALAALCYAELAAMVPQAGSAYAYTYATLGELVAWIVGWDLIIEYAVGNVRSRSRGATTSTLCCAAWASTCRSSSRRAIGRPCSAPTPTCADCWRPRRVCLAFRF
jgi:amino acid permease